MWNPLTKTALVGTDRSPLPALDGSLADIAAAMSDQPAESVLLALAGAASLRELAGYAPPPFDGELPTQAADETLPLCNRAAAQLLALFVSERNYAMLNEWILVCSEARQRPPTYLLPAILEHGKDRDVVHEAVATITGERGRWLAAHRDRWQPPFAAATPAAWRDTRVRIQQRVLALRQARQQDPAAARDDFAAHMDNEDVNNRVQLLAAFTENLSLDDEPFLESLLDGKSRRVARAAADLLGSLDGSAYVGRMIARAEAIIEYKPTRKKDPLKVTPITALDESMKRDTINRDKPKQVSEQDAWTRFVFANVPPAWYTEKLSTAPAEQAVEALNGKAARDTALYGLKQATVRCRDMGWAWLLLKDALATGRIDTRDNLWTDLLDCLPVSQREQLYQQYLAADSKGEHLFTVAQLARHHWSELFTHVMLDTIVAGVRQNPRMAYRFSTILPDMAHYADPDSHDALFKTLTPLQEDKHTYYTLRQPIEKFLTTLRYRRDIRRAFLG